MTSFEASCKMHHNNITADSIRKRRNLVECAFCFGKRDVDGLFNIPKVFHLIPYSARVHVCVGDISSIFVLFTIRRPRCFYVTSFYEKYPERENIDSVYSFIFNRAHHCFGILFGVYSFAAERNMYFDDKKILGVLSFARISFRERQKGKNFLSRVHFF